MIATDIDAGNLTGCNEGSTGVLINAINDENLIDCADITVSDDGADGLIDIAINAGNSTDCADDDAGGYIANIDAAASMNLADL